MNSKPISELAHPNQLTPAWLQSRLIPLNSDDIPHWSHIGELDNPRQAAVLIPLLEQADGTVKLLLTERAAHLPSHPGEISFPGGAVEPEDADLLATAIRETQEETGIQAELVVPLGVLGELNTISGYCLRAYVGWVKAGASLQAEVSEVASLILADADFALDAQNFRWQERKTIAGIFNLPEIELEGHRVWGVTGVLLWRLAQRLSQD